MSRPNETPDSKDRFDVIVIGGGPAGSAAALTLKRRGYSTAVIERSEYADVRIGETLPPAIRKLMASLGVWDRFVSENHAPSFGNYSAWGNDVLHANDFIFNAYGSGWHVDRARFDAMLAQSASLNGVRIFQGEELVSISDSNSGGWDLKIANRRGSLAADFLVDATGRRASVARKLGAKRISYDHLIGLVGFFSPTSPDVVCDSRTLVESEADGWWYSAFLPDRRLVAAFMTDSDLCPADQGRADFWQAKFEKAPHTFSRVAGHSGSTALSSAVATFAANSSRLDTIFGERWVAAGDAAAAYDPLSSQGVYRALESGINAANAIADRWAGQDGALGDYAAAMRLGFDSYLGQRNRYYGLERRWPGSTFWQRRRSQGESAAGSV